MTSERQSSRAGLRLTSGTPLPDLRIVSRSQVHLHEECDPARVDRLVIRLREDEVLRHPPIAATLPEDGFVVLDGANRTSALLALESPAIPVQVVDYDDPSVRLEVWHHLLVKPIDLLARLRARGLTVHPATPSEAARRLEERAIACYLVTRTGTATVAVSSERQVAQTLATVVAAYQTTDQIYRVTNTNVDALARQYGTVGELVVFPTLTKPDIVEVARSPQKFPTGITRHLIPGRVLRLNIPLNILTSAGDIATKNRWLADELRRKLLNHEIRYYPEATFQFDE